MDCNPTGAITGAFVAHFLIVFINRIGMVRFGSLAAVNLIQKDTESKGHLDFDGRIQ